MRHGRRLGPVLGNCERGTCYGAQTQKAEVPGQAAFDWAGKQSSPEQLAARFNFQDSEAARRRVLGWLAVISRRIVGERIVDAGERPAPLDPANFVQTVDRVGLMVSGIVGQFLAWTASFQEHPFEIREIDPKFLATAQGDPNTTYHYSYWELADDEVYSVVLEPPERFDYWNLQIGNHWLESFDYHHYDTHVNHETAVLEKDGKVRISISARDPGRPNWLDTAGHRRGALALRWVGADSPPPRPRVSVDKISTTPFAG